MMGPIISYPLLWVRGRGRGQSDTHVTYIHPYLVIDDKPVTGSGDSMSTNLYIGNINPKVTHSICIDDSTHPP